jgi:DNA polymerase-3 subunit gamma/tau
MTYQVLARRCRPRTFAALVGQDAVSRAITNGLEQNRLHHAYLFTGTRGVGKTSIARLLAKALNCEQGVSSTPCLTCDTCVAIEQGRFIDLIEIDAASKTRVEDTRELLENIQYAPSLGRFKIYLVDEVHMLSTHSFNALLKTLEEPPAHVKFILATTDADKLPATILSRCLKFNLKPLAPSIIESQMAMILSQENMTYETRALELIAHAAQGSMRDALSILDQAITYAQNKSLEAADVKTLLGYTQNDYAIQLLQALSVQKPESIFAISQAVAAEGGHFTYVLDTLLSYCHQIALYKAIAPAHPHMTLMPDLLTLAEKFSAEEIQLFYQIGLKGKSDMALAPGLLIGFEMTLLRMHAFQLKTPEMPQIQAISSVTKNNVRQIPADVPVTPDLPPNLAPKAQESYKDIAAISTPLVPKTLPAWAELITQLKLTGLTKNAAEQAEWVNKTDYKVILRINKNNQTLFNAPTVTRIELALSDYFKNKVQLELLTDKPTDNSPAQQKVQQSTLKTEESTQALKNDPVFSAIEEIFEPTWELEVVQK